MHAVLPETLLDRLLLHHRVEESAMPDLDGHSEIGPDQMQSLDHMFYTSAVIAVYQLMQVRISTISTGTLVLTVRVCSVWMNCMLSRVGFAGKYLFAALRSGSSCTSRGVELIRAVFHERIRLLNESRSSRVKSAVGKGFKKVQGLKLSSLTNSRDHNLSSMIAGRWFTVVEID
jgi:hypothetical protein